MESLMGNHFETIHFVILIIILLVLYNKLSKIDRYLLLILKKEEMAQEDLDALTVEVQKNTDTEASAITLLQGLKTALDAAIASAGQDNGAALQALSSKLGTSADALAAAIVANTPAAEGGA